KFNDVTFRTLPEFRARLADLLSPGDLAKYQTFLVKVAAITEVPDRVTGEPKTVWARDDNGNFIVLTDAEGRPVPLINKDTGGQQDPLGFLARLLPPSWAENLRRPARWLSLVGVLGVLLAFGHSILAMSGEETLAQVYREVESPKLPNFKKAAFIVFLYSLLF